MIIEYHNVTDSVKVAYEYRDYENFKFHRSFLLLVRKGPVTLF